MKRRSLYESFFSFVELLVKVTYDKLSETGNIKLYSIRIQTLHSHKRSSYNTNTSGELQKSNEDLQPVINHWLEVFVGISVSWLNGCKYQAERSIDDDGEKCASHMHSGKKFQTSIPICGIPKWLSGSRTKPASNDTKRDADGETMYSRINPAAIRIRFDLMIPVFTT